MNARGQYGSAGKSWGSGLVHILELKQRYDNAKTDAVQSLLNTLSREGVVVSVGAYRWEIALKDGAWVMLVYDPDWKALEVTITNRELRDVDQMEHFRRVYEAILSKITPRLQSFGATTVGAATYAGQTPVPRLTLRARAIRAVFDMYTRARAPFYIYAEVNGKVDRRSALSLDEANAIFFALERSPGEVYVAIFDPTDPLWPGPAFDVYNAAPLPQDRPTIAGCFDGSDRGHYGSPREMVGITIYHSVGDRAAAVKQMDIDWNVLYQSLASQAGELTPDPKSPSGYRIATQLEWDAHPPDPKKVTWWKSYASPIIKQWVKFKHEQLGGDRTVADSYISFAERFQTNWDVYENWKKKLDALRADAEKRGFTIGAPATTPLPTTVWSDVATTVEKGAGAVAGGIGDVWTIVKYGAWAVLGIGAVVALSSVVQNLRSGKDPGAKYVELIRQGRRSSAAAPRALPAPARLALPPGGA